MFVLISWMCEKQTSVSHSATESKIISSDAGLRLDDKPALVSWDQIVVVRHGIVKNGESCARTCVRFVQHTHTLRTKAISLNN